MALQVNDILTLSYVQQPLTAPIEEEAEVLEIMRDSAVVKRQAGNDMGSSASISLISQIVGSNSSLNRYNGSTHTRPSLKLTKVTQYSDTTKCVFFNHSSNPFRVVRDRYSPRFSQTMLAGLNSSFNALPVDVKEHPGSPRYWRRSPHRTTRWAWRVSAGSLSRTILLGYKTRTLTDSPLRSGEHSALAPGFRVIE